MDQSSEQAREIDLRTFPDDLLTRCRRQHLGCHIEYLLEYRQFVPGILEAFRWLRLLEIGEQLADFTQRIDALLTHAQGDAAWRAEQIGEHGHRRAFRLLDSCAFHEVSGNIGLSQVSMNCACLMP